MRGRKSRGQGRAGARPAPPRPGVGRLVVASILEDDASLDSRVENDLLGIAEPLTESSGLSLYPTSARKPSLSEQEAGAWGPSDSCEPMDDDSDGMDLCELFGGDS